MIKEYIYKYKSSMCRFSAPNKCQTIRQISYDFSHQYKPCVAMILDIASIVIIYVYIFSFEKKSGGININKDR